MRIYAAWTKISTFAPDISDSLKDISITKFQLSPSLIFSITRFQSIIQTDKGDVKCDGETPRKPRAHCLLPHVSMIVARRVQSA